LRERPEKHVSIFQALFIKSLPVEMGVIRYSMMISFNRDPVFISQGIDRLEQKLKDPRCDEQNREIPDPG
jgi:hypothetical protein